MRICNLPKLALALALAVLSGSAWAQDVTIIGEVHDNPRHHEVQAEKVAQIAPRAIVFEMLDTDQAARIGPDTPRDEARLAELLEWEKSGWPDFGMYYQIFAAAPEARVYGAGVSRAAARQAMEGGFDAVMEGEAVRFGLTEPLPEAEQEAREALQMAAHCDALPEDMLPAMVRIQRLRDAKLARKALLALEETGGPVVVITGNGHARQDWGAPALIAKAAPEVDVYVIGQTEDGQPLSGGFDETLSAPAAAREDPCAAFR